MKIAIFGTSGFGREVADICAEVGYGEIVFLVKDEDEICIWPNKVIVDTAESVKELADSGYEFAIGIGEPKIRKLVANKYPTLNYPNLIHPSATFGLYQLDIINQSKGIIITAGCRITNSISFGNFVVLNLNVTVGHDSDLGDFVSIMPGATISGNVHLEDCVYIGTGSSVIHGGNNKKLRIGDSAIVGAGAVVTREVLANQTVVGIPAKPLSR